MTDYPDERATLPIGAFGDDENFFTLKGMVEAVAKTLNICFAFEETTLPFLHPYRAAKILCNGEEVGFMGQITYEIQKAEDMRAPGFVAQLDLKSLEKYYDIRPKFVPLPKFDEESFKKLYGRELSRFDDTKPGEFDMCNSLGDLAKHSLLGKIVLKLVISFAYRMMKVKPKDDPEVMMMVEAIKDGTLDLVLSEGGGALPYNLGEAVVLSANGQKLKAIAKLFGK